MVKREHTDDELSEDDDSEKTAVNPTAKKAKPSPSPSKGKAKQPTPRKTPSTSQSSPVRQTPLISGSAKSRLGEMIIECGIKNYSKSEAQILVGLLKT
jgi:hypothetical protein